MNITFIINIRYNSGVVGYLVAVALILYFLLIIKYFGRINFIYLKRKENILAFWISLTYWSISCCILFSMIYDATINYPVWITGFFSLGYFAGIIFAFVNTHIAAIIIIQILTFAFVFLVFRFLIQLVNVFIQFFRKN